MRHRKLGEIVRELREARGLTQAQLAQVALSYVLVIESEKQGAPPRAILQRVARALGVPVERLQEPER